MPNHMTNEITINGSEAEIKEVKKFLMGVPNEKGDSNPFDFNKLKPIPKELVGTKSPMDIITQHEYNVQEAELAEFNRKIADGEKLTDKEKQHEAWGFSRCLTKELSDDYKKTFGSDDWYDWQCEAWGTKWNSYNHWGFDDEENGNIGFQTAWSHPAPIIEMLSLKFPNILFELRFADEDFGQNLGSYSMKNGVERYLNLPEGGSMEAYRLAHDILGGEDYNLYDVFLEYDEDEWDEFLDNMLILSVEKEYIDEDLPHHVLEKALPIALENEQFELASVIKKGLEKKNTK